jgi:hypothetical protein
MPTELVIALAFLGVVAGILVLLIHGAGRGPRR